MVKVTGALTTMVKRPERIIFCVDVQNPWSYTFIALYVIRPAT